MRVADGGAKAKKEAEQFQSESGGAQMGVQHFEYRVSGPKAEAERNAVKKESLGTQMIEGVAAEGTRTTLTIPAGAMGNERPIEVVTESWYSNQLHTTVMSKTTDPRAGETVYSLKNIRLAEPAQDLFAIPSDYIVQ